MFFQTGRSQFTPSYLCAPNVAVIHDPTAHSLTSKCGWGQASGKRMVREQREEEKEILGGVCPTVFSLWIIIITRHQTGGDVAVRSFSLGIRCIIVTLWPRSCPFLTETCRASSRYKKKPSINAKMTFPRTQNTLPEARATQ